MLQMPDCDPPLRWRQASARRGVIALACLVLAGCASAPDDPSLASPADADAAIATQEPAPAGADSTAMAAPRSLEDLQRAFDERRPSLRRVNSTRASRNAGTVVVRLTVAPDGSVVECRIVSTDFDDAAFNAAVVAEAWRVYLEPRDVGEFTYPAYPITFAAPEPIPSPSPVPGSDPHP